MIIIDTTVWIDYFRGITTPRIEWLVAELARQRLGLTDLIFCEGLQGVKDDATFQMVQRELLKLEVFSIGGIALSISAARNYRKLRVRFTPYTDKAKT